MFDLYFVECRVGEDTWTTLDCLPLPDAERLAEFMKLEATYQAKDIRIVPVRGEEMPEIPAGGKDA